MKSLKILAAMAAAVMMIGCIPSNDSESYSDGKHSNKDISIEIENGNIRLSPTLYVRKAQQEGHDIYIYIYDSYEEGGISVVHAFECEKCKYKKNRNYYE